jgi:hypothetical protein
LVCLDLVVVGVDMADLIVTVAEDSLALGVDNINKVDIRLNQVPQLPNLAKQIILNNGLNITAAWE